MKDYRSALIALAWRALPAAALGGGGWYLVATAEGGVGALPQLLAAMGLFLAAALLLARPLAALVGESAGGYLYPDRPLERPMPPYGIPEALRKRGEYAEALAQYRAIAAQYPQELRAYVEMIDLAIVDLRDRNLALAVLQQGLDALERQDDREALLRLHAGISSRLDPRPTPPRPHLKG
jgi:hypothetical protein